MSDSKLGFEDFILSVDIEHSDFIRKLHDELTVRGCKIEVKAAKSGYLVSYISEKKTIANFVFRKKGMMVRIYANHIKDYMNFLETLPQGMIQSIQESPVCKRLINPSACNSRCSMGYEFFLCGEHYQKCRNGAFMFFVSAENNPFIKDFLLSEVNAAAEGKQAP